MTDQDRKKATMERMAELMIPIDNAIMMSDNVLELLMLASNMLVTAKDIYLQQLGGKATKELFVNFTGEIDERILPVGRKVPPSND